MPGLDDIHELSKRWTATSPWQTPRETKRCYWILTESSVTRDPDSGRGTFHLNQVLESASGELLGLVHHVDGRQLSQGELQEDC